MPIARASRLVALLVARLGYDAVFLTAILSVKAAMAVGLYASGFAGVSADEYTRSIFAMMWAQSPHLVAGKTAWLPFEQYLNGALLRIVPNPLWIPRLTVFIASCVLIAFYYKLVRLLFESRFAATVSAVGLTVFPWYAWLSATPALDEYYVAAMLAGLYYAARWAIERCKIALYAASGAFFLATGFHYQSWLVLAVIDLGNLWLLARLCRSGDWSSIAHQVMATLIAHIYIMFTLTTTYRDAGNPFAFLESHNEFTKELYGGYAVSPIEKLLYYPRLLVTESNPIFGALAIYGAALRTSEGRGLRVRALLMLGLGVIAAYSLFNLWSVPPSAAPGRFALIFYVLLLPYAGLALDRLVKYPQFVATRTQGAQWLVALCLVLGTLWGLNQVRQFGDRQGWNGAVKAGYVISDLLREVDPKGGYLIELVSRWEWMGVKLSAGHYDNQYFDRPFDRYPFQSGPSWLEAGSDEFAAQLRSRRIVAMAFKDPQLIARAREFGEIVSSDRGWVVLRVRF